MQFFACIIRRYQERFFPIAWLIGAIPGCAALTERIQTDWKANTILGFVLAKPLRLSLDAVGFVLTKPHL
jgi:hypothetical protein